MFLKPCSSNLFSNLRYFNLSYSEISLCDSRGIERFDTLGLELGLEFTVDDLDLDLWETDLERKL